MICRFYKSSIVDAVLYLRTVQLRSLHVVLHVVISLVELSKNVVVLFTNVVVPPKDAICSPLSSVTSSTEVSTNRW